jgi:hypothetical protein
MPSTLGPGEHFYFLGLLLFLEGEEVRSGRQQEHAEHVLSPHTSHVSNRG